VADDTNLIVGYSDFSQIGSYAKEALAWVYQAGNYERRVCVAR